MSQNDSWTEQEAFMSQQQTALEVVRLTELTG